jgi:hypothetical protein
MDLIFISVCVAGVLFALLSFILFIKFYKLKKVIKKLSDAYKTLDMMINLKDDTVLDSDIHKENFIKFLSDSRDWAYEYIDSVQQSVDSLLKKTESTIEYHKEFKSLEIEPYATHIETLVSAIDELKILLPDKEKT